MRAIEKKVFFFVRQGCLFPWDSGGQKKRVHIKAMYGKGGGGSLLGPCLLKSLGVTLLARVTLLISRSQALSCCFDVATSIRHGMVIYAAPSKIADVFWYVRHSSVLRASGSHPVPGRNKEALKLRHGGGVTFGVIIPPTDRRAGGYLHYIKKIASTLAVSSMNSRVDSHLCKPRDIPAARLSYRW